MHSHPITKFQVTRINDTAHIEVTVRANDEQGIPEQHFLGSLDAQKLIEAIIQLVPGGVLIVPGVDDRWRAMDSEGDVIVSADSPVEALIGLLEQHDAIANPVAQA